VAGRVRKEQAAKAAKSLEQRLPDSRSLFTKVDRAHVLPDHMASFTAEAVA
jgi:hypothetical protein